MFQKEEGEDMPKGGGVKGNHPPHLSRTTPAPSPCHPRAIPAPFPHHPHFPAPRADRGCGPLWPATRESQVEGILDNHNEHRGRPAP